VATGQLGAQSNSVEVTDEEDTLEKEEMGGGTGRAGTLGVQVGDELVTVRPSPAEDDLLESLGQARPGVVAGTCGGLGRGQHSLTSATRQSTLEGPSATSEGLHSAHLVHAA
jgi:hypothetical protein